MRLLQLAATILRKAMSLVLLVSLIIMSCSVLIQILVRELFSTSILPLDDIIPYSFSISIFSGASLLFGENGHVAITIFSDILPRRIRTAIIVFSHLVVLAFLVFFLYFGYEFMLDGQWQFSPLLNIPLGYIYAVVPLCALTSIVLMLESLLCKKEQESAEIHAI